MPRILLIRHAQASFGSGAYDQLSTAGIRQSELLAAALRRHGVVPSRLVSGSLRRQLETAAPFAEHGEPIVDERWNEYDSNDVLAHHAETAKRIDGAASKGISSREFQAVLEPALESWIAAGDASPGALSWTAFSSAGRTALTELAADLGPGETALVFTSGGAIAAACASVLGTPEAFIGLNRVSVNSSVTKLIAGRSGLTLLTFNDHAHLEDADQKLITYR